MLSPIWFTWEQNCTIVAECMMESRCWNVQKCPMWPWSHKKGNISKCNLKNCLIFQNAIWKIDSCSNLATVTMTMGGPKTADNCGLLPPEAKAWTNPHRRRHYHHQSNSWRYSCNQSVVGNARDSSNLKLWWLKFFSGAWKCPQPKF